MKKCMEHGLLQNVTSARWKMRAQVIPEEIGLPEVDLKFTSGDVFSDSHQFNENIIKEGN